MVQSWLVINSMVSILCTVSFFTLHCLRHSSSDKESLNNLVQVFAVLKLATMSPFITFEYYMIIFEHIFVDATL